MMIKIWECVTYTDRLRELGLFGPKRRKLSSGGDILSTSGNTDVQK